MRTSVGTLVIGIPVPPVFYHKILSEHPVDLNFEHSKWQDQGITPTPGLVTPKDRYNKVIFLSEN